MAKPVFRPTTPRDVAAIDQRLRRLERRPHTQCSWFFADAGTVADPPADWEASGGGESEHIHWKYATTSDRQAFGTSDGTMVAGDYAETNTLLDHLILIKQPGIFFAQALVTATQDATIAYYSTGLHVDGAPFRPFGSPQGNSMAWGGSGLDDSIGGTSGGFAMAAESMNWGSFLPPGNGVVLVKPSFYDSLWNSVTPVEIRGASIKILHWTSQEPIVDLFGP